MWPLTTNLTLGKFRFLTHWGRVTHICVSKLSIIGSDNGLSPGRRQAIIWTNAGILLIRTLGTNFSEILCEIHSFSFSKMHLKMSSAKWRLFGLGLTVLMATHVWKKDRGFRWFISWYIALSMRGHKLSQCWFFYIKSTHPAICFWNTIILVKNNIFGKAIC